MTPSLPEPPVILRSVLNTFPHISVCPRSLFLILFGWVRFLNLVWWPIDFASRLVVRRIVRLFLLYVCACVCLAQVGRDRKGRCITGYIVAKSPVSTNLLMIANKERERERERESFPVFLFFVLLAAHASPLAYSFVCTGFLFNNSADSLIYYWTTCCLVLFQHYWAVSVINFFQLLLNQ